MAPKKDAINITKTEEIQAVLDELKARFLTLNEEEIMKLALSELYHTQFMNDDDDCGEYWGDDEWMEMCGEDDDMCCAGENGDEDKGM